MLLEYSRREVHCTEPCPPLLYTPSSCCSKRKSLSSWSSNALPTCCEVHLICMLPILGVKNPPIVQPNQEEALPPVLLLTTCHEGIAAPTHLAICRLLPCTKDYYWTPILVVQLWMQQRGGARPCRSSRSSNLQGHCLRVWSFLNIITSKYTAERAHIC